MARSSGHSTRLSPAGRLRTPWTTPSNRVQGPTSGTHICLDHHILQLAPRNAGGFLHTLQHHICGDLQHTGG